MSEPDGSEVFTIFVGQAGVQLATAFWNLFCYEHEIDQAGYFKTSNPRNNLHYPFFASSENEKQTPRTILVDSEPTLITNIREGPCKALFDEESLISGKEDARGNYAMGYKAIGETLLQKTQDHIRKMCEKCSKMDGLIVFRSCCGGTGSGFTTLLLENLKDDFNKNMKFGFTIQNAPNLVTTHAAEAYNSVLSTHHTMDLHNCCFVTDNEALYRICDSHLYIDRTTYRNLNCVLAQIIAGIFALLRFKPVKSLTQIKEYLVPKPRLHFLLMAYSPFNVFATKAAMKSPNSNFIQTITKDCFKKDNQLLTWNADHGLYLRSYLLYRGSVSENDAREALRSVREECPLFFSKNSSLESIYIPQEAAVLPGTNLSFARQSLLSLANNTVIAKTWEKILYKFDLMYKRKAYVHYYVSEGIEESVFEIARENMFALEKEYSSLAKDTSEN